MQGNTALHAAVHFAIRTGHRDAVKCLLKEDAKWALIDAEIENSDVRLLCVIPSRVLHFAHML